MRPMGNNRINWAEGLVWRDLARYHVRGSGSIDHLMRSLMRDMRQELP